MLKNSPDEWVEDEDSKLEISDCTKRLLLKMQVDTAMEGDTKMLIWLGKQFLGQADNAVLLQKMSLPDGNEE